MLIDTTRGAWFAALGVGLLFAGSATQAETISNVRQNYGDGELVDEITGVVVQDLVHMDYHMGRIHIQDAAGGLYSGIAVVDQEGSSGTFVRSLAFGDEVTLRDVTFGDRGTFGNDVLYFTPGMSSFVINGGAALPGFTDVGAADIFGGPSAGVGEEYQSMRLRVNDVEITEMYPLGRKDDNYALVDGNGDTFWAADYTNKDKQYSGIYWDTMYHHTSCPDNPEASRWDWDYNPISDDGYGGVGQQYAYLSGILEASQGDPYDYYQLLTWDNGSFGFESSVPEPASATLLLAAVGLLALGRRRGRPRAA